MNAIQIYTMIFGAIQAIVLAVEFVTGDMEEATNSIVAMALFTPITGRVMGWW